MFIALPYFFFVLNILYFFFFLTFLFFSFFFYHIPPLDVLSFLFLLSIYTSHFTLFPFPFTTFCPLIFPDLLHLLRFFSFLPSPFIIMFPR